MLFLVFVYFQLSTFTLLQWLRVHMPAFDFDIRPGNAHRGASQRSARPWSDHELVPPVPSFARAREDANWWAPPPPKASSARLARSGRSVKGGQAAAEAAAAAAAEAAAAVELEAAAEEPDGSDEQEGAAKQEEPELSLAEARTDSVVENDGMLGVDELFDEDEGADGAADGGADGGADDGADEMAVGGVDSFTAGGTNGTAATVGAVTGKVGGWIESDAYGRFIGISTFFNPGRHANKVDNFRKFRASVAEQGLQLLCVELVFGELPFQASPTPLSPVCHTPMTPPFISPHPCPQILTSS
jgi:hypothetical protein